MARVVRGHGLTAVLTPASLCQPFQLGTMREYAAILSAVTGALLILMALFKSDALQFLSHANPFWPVAFGAALLIASVGILLNLRWESRRNDRKNSGLS